MSTSETRNAKNKAELAAPPPVSHQAIDHATDQPNAKHGSAIRIARVIVVVLIAAIAFGATVAAVTALHDRAASIAAPPANPAISVATEPVRWSDHYIVARNFVGRLEAARQTAIAFERGGLVVAINVDEGDRITNGSVIARLDTAKLQANRGELAARRRELEAQRDLARLTKQRQGKLQTRGWSPMQRYDEARFSLQRLEAAIARVDAAIAALDVDIAKSSVTAPFDGEVGARDIDEGTVVAAGTRVMTLLETGARHARIGVSPEAATGLKVSNTYQLTANGHPIAARLRAKRADLEIGSRTVTALFELLPGQVGKTNVPLGEVVVLSLPRKVDASGIWLPISALVEGRKGLWTVMLAQPGGDGETTIRREAVEVLHVAGTRAFVRGALEEGDRVVTTGTNRITPGQRVAIVPSS